MYKNILLYYMADDKKLTKKKTKNIALQVLKLFVIGLSVILVVLFFNANMIYLIKKAGDEVLNKIFPSNCNDLPYGTENLSPCEDIEWVEVKKGGDSKKCKTEPSIPYRWYKKDSINIFQDYLNWYLQSLAYGQTRMHKSLKEVLENHYLNKLPNSVLLIIGFLALFLLPLLGIYTFFLYSYKQIKSAIYMQHGIFVSIAALFTCFLVGGLNYLVAHIDVLVVLFKLVIYPSFFEHRSKFPEIKNIIASQQSLVGYLIGFLFIYILLKIPMNKHYEKPVKIIPTVFFFLLAGIHLIHYLINLFKSFEGAATTKKC